VDFKKERYSCKEKTFSSAYERNASLPSPAFPKRSANPLTAAAMDVLEDFDVVEIAV